MPLSKDQSMTSIYIVKRPTDLFRCACAVFFLTRCCLDDSFTSISFHKKALSTLNIYKIVIRLKSQVLRKEDSRACDSQTDMQIFFRSCSKPLGTLDRRAHHLSLQGGPKSPPHVFFVFTNLDCFDLGTSLKKLCFKPRQ